MLIKKKSSAPPYGIHNECSLNFSSPHSPAYRKDERELCGGESSFSVFLVQQQNIPLYFSFLSQAVSYILVTQITTLNFTESPET